MGIVRLGQILTIRMFERDIEQSNKFRKIEKQTMMRLMKNIKKERVQEVVESIKEFNRGVLVENKIKELVDDTIYLNIRFAKNMDSMTQNTKIRSIGGQTPV